MRGGGRRLTSALFILVVSVPLKEISTSPTATPALSAGPPASTVLATTLPSRSARLARADPCLTMKLASAGAVAALVMACVSATPAMDSLSRDCHVMQPHHVSIRRWVPWGVFDGPPGAGKPS